MAEISAKYFFQLLKPHAPINIGTKYPTNMRPYRTQHPKLLKTGFSTPTTKPVESGKQELLQDKDQQLTAREKLLDEKEDNLREREKLVEHLTHQNSQHLKEIQRLKHKLTRQSVMEEHIDGLNLKLTHSLIEIIDHVDPDDPSTMSNNALTNCVRNIILCQNGILDASSQHKTINVSDPENPTSPPEQTYSNTPIHRDPSTQTHFSDDMSVDELDNSTSDDDPLLSFFLTDAFYS